jgi:hypothetical protein
MIFGHQRERKKIWSLNDRLREGSSGVLPEAGSFTIFASADGGGELRLPLGASNGRFHGALTFAFASALAEMPKASIRRLAERTEAIAQQMAVDPNNPRPDAFGKLRVLESSAPEITFFSYTAESSARDRVARAPARLGFEVIAPSATRGYVRATESTLAIEARLLDTSNLQALLVAGKPVEVKYYGRFSVTLPVSSIGPVVEVLGLYRVRESTGHDFMEFRKGEIPIDLQAASPQETLANGRRIALVIANWEYVGTGFIDLVTPEPDATELSEILRNRYGFRTSVDEPEGSRVSLELRNSNRREILSTINRLRQLLRPEDSLLIFYAGHGMYISEVDEAYWIPRDGGKDDITSWISARDITTQLRLMPARHVLVIADSCYSGALLRGSDAANEPPTGKTERAGFLSAAFARTSRFLMSSGGVEPVQDGGGSGHSVFAAALLKGLSDTTQEAFTADELFTSYIAESVAGRSEQVPQMQPIRASGHEGGRFIFVKSTPPP